MTEAWLLKIKIDKSNRKAVYIQIADGIIQLIKKGVLKANTTLPGTRVLATKLAVNRNTLVRALDVLINEGWLISEERKRIYVSDKVLITGGTKKKEAHKKHIEQISNDVIFFDDGLPDASCTPMEELARAYRRIFTRKGRWQIMNLTSELGDERFRETISSMLNDNRGMSTSLSDICITRGSQMAFFLTAHCLFKKGDLVLVENPGFKAAWETFEHAGATLIPIAVDQDGINIQQVEEVLKKETIKAIYLTPHHQYPTTVTLSLARRLRLIELSNTYNFTLIEDDYDNEYHFTQRPVMPISAHEEAENYVYIGTLSKLIAPAVRIGYIVSSPQFIAQIADLRRIVDRQGDTIMELSILELILSGDIRRHRKRMLSYYEKKRDYFSELLDYYMKDKVTYRKPDGGLAFWVQPIQAVNLAHVKKQVNAKYVSFYTPERFSFDKTITGIRLGYASLTEEKLEEGLRILSKHL